MKNRIVNVIATVLCTTLSFDSVILAYSTIDDYYMNIEYEFVYSDNTGRMYNDEEEIGGFIARL